MSIAVIVVTASLILGAGVAQADPSANDWLRIRQCESGNNYAINTGNGYYGAYQFDLGTWRSVGGTGYPNQASPATQDALALKLWRQRGWSPWTCARNLGLSSSPTAPAPTRPPAGHVDAVRVSGLSAFVQGWAVDPNNPSVSIPVHVYVGSAGYAFTANRARADVNRVLGVTGNHGFSNTVPLKSGANNVCVYGIGVKPANNKLLSCRTVQAVPPTQGSFDRLAVSGATATVSGWALDRNAPTRSIAVHVYVTSGSTRTALVGTTANRPRPDVNRILGVSGQHGYSVTVPVKAGSRVCVYAISVVPGNNGLIGCRSN